MTTAGTVTVDVQGRDVNLVALLTRLEGQMRQTDQTGIRLSQTTAGTFTAAQTKAANAALQEAQALARAAVAVGDDARAHQILTTALGQNAAASDRATASVVAQLGRLQSGKTIATEFGASLKSGLLGVVGPAAAATAAIGALQAVAGQVEAGFRLKAELDATRQSITSLLGETKNSNQVFAEATQFANRYRITQQETNNILSSSVDILRTTKSSVSDLEANLIRLQSRDVSKPISEAARALRELQAGDTTSIKELFNVPAREANRMKAEILAGGDAVQVLGAYLDRAGIGMNILENRTKGAAGKMNELAKASEDLSLALGSEATGPGLAILETRIAATRTATQALQGDFLSLNAVLGAGTNLATLPNALIAYNAEALRLVGILPEATAATDQQTQAATANTQATLQNAQVVTFSAAAYDTQRQAAQIAAQGVYQQAAALEVEAVSSQLNQAQSQLLTTEKERLAQQALFTAQSLLDSGQAGAAAAAQLANSSSLIDRLTAAYYRLAVAKQQATGGVTEGRLERDTAADRAQVGSDKALAAQKVYLAKLNDTHKRAGAVRLSDQQKLNNQLADNQQRYDQQAEQAAKEHARRLIDIERDYQKRSLEQQQKNEISKRESELGFLESITSSELNKTKTGRAEIQRINERFYADFDAAQKAAQAGNAEQSEKLVELARKRADAELEYAQKIAEAQANKDAAEVARLEALREKRRQILDEEQKQIAGGGDANKNARDEALAAEKERFAEQQDKNAQSAENAAERKVSAAVRSGKAVQAENAALREQEQIYARIGGRAAPGTAPGTASAAAPAAPATVDWGAISSLLQSIVDAVNTQGGTVATAATNAGDKVARAVGSRAVRA